MHVGKKGKDKKDTINRIRELPNKFIICTYQNNINPYKPQKPILLEYDKIIKLSGLFNERDVCNLIIEFCSRSILSE